jgi:hypothetical protein
MSFAGIVLACWLLIAALAFLALSALTWTASREDVEADLGIVGPAELRMLLGEGEERLPLEARLARLGIPSPRQPAGAGQPFTTGAHSGAAYMLDSGRASLGGGWESIETSYVT